MISETAADTSNLKLTEIDLSSRVPLSDPGAYYTGLYSTLSAFEVTAKPSSIAAFLQAFRNVEELCIAKFLLIDLAKHHWLAVHSFLLTEIAQELQLSHNVRLVSFGTEFSMCRDWNAAIELCLKEHEPTVLARFGW